MKIKVISVPCPQPANSAEVVRTLFNDNPELSRENLLALCYAAGVIHATAARELSNLKDWRE